MNVATPPPLLRRSPAAWRLPTWPAPLIVLGFAFLPFLASSLFPSQDGPAHLHTASLLAMIREGRAPVASALLAEIDPGVTNIAAYWILSRLLDVMPAVAAEWTMALGLTALLLGAVLAAIRLLGGRAWDAVPGVLLCAPLMLYMGSFALVLAMAPAFLALAFAVRLLRSGRGVDAAAFLLLALAACAVQVQAAVPILAAVFGGAAGAVGWRWLRGGGFAVPRPLLLLALACVPVMLAVVAFQMGPPRVAHAADTPAWSPIAQAGAMVLRRDVAAFSLTGAAALGVATLALGLVALVWLLRAGWRDDARAGAPGTTERLWPLFAAIAVAGAVMVLPRETSAIPQIPQRLLPFAFFLLFLWFVVTPLPPRWRGVVVGTATAAALLVTAGRTQGHAVLGGHIRAELAWAEAQLPDGVTALVSFPGALVARSPAMEQAGFLLAFDAGRHLGRGLAGRDVVALSNYQVMPVWRIFRLRMRPEVYEPLGDVSELSVMVGRGGLRDGLGAFRARLRDATGHDLDTVVLWTGGIGREAAAVNPDVAAFLRELDAGYEQAGVSAPSGLAEVWRRRPG